MSVGWFEQLPAGWTSTQLRHVARVFAGGTPDRKRDDFWSGGTIPWLNSGSVNQGVITEPSELVTARAVSGGATRFVASKSVVIALAGQGKTKGMAARTEIRTTLNQSLAAIEPSDVLDYRFLHYWLKSNYANIRNLAGGDLRDGLNLGHIGGIRVPLPSPAAQRQIADYLDHETAEIDAFIADLELFHSLEEERLDATVDSAFLTLAAPRVPLKRLGLEQSAGVSVNAASWPAEEGRSGVLKTGSVSKGIFDPSENKAVMDEAEINRLACPVVADSIVVNRANTPHLVGRAAYVDTGHPALFLSDLLWRVRFAHGLTEYVGAWMTTRAYRDAVQTIRVGASSTMQKISFERFSEIALPLPNDAERRSVIDRVKCATASRAAMRAEIDAAIALAKERRAALITAAVTGQIDVTAKQVPAVDSIQTTIEESR